MTYDATKAFARTVAEVLEREMPDRATANMAKDRRTGKVLVDWSQNSAHKSAVAPYSLRAKTADATVSTPMSWEELDAAVRAEDPRRLHFEYDEVLARVERLGDLWAPVLSTTQRLPAS